MYPSVMMVFAIWVSRRLAEVCGFKHQNSPHFAMCTGRASCEVVKAFPGVHRQHSLRVMFDIVL